MVSTIGHISTVERSHGRGTVWAGRIISGIAVLFMLFDSITKIMQAPAVLKASANLGYSAGTIPVIGTILLACVVVYLIPRTSTLGAVLLTGYPGGAVASSLRIGTPLSSDVLFSVNFGIMIWAGLCLRDAQVRTFFSSKKKH